MLNFKVTILSFFVIIIIFNKSFSASFSERKEFNKILNGFYKNNIFKCQYINKTWSVGFEDHPYGMVLNSTAFSDVLVFEYKSMIGTLWPNIGEISTDRGVRKYQLWKKMSKDEFILVESDYKSDLNSSDIDTKNTNDNHKTYFDRDSLKIAVKSWITDFYSCEELNSSNFARKKLIDIFVNQDEYVKKDFSFRESNPNSFQNKIELLSK